MVLIDMDMPKNCGKCRFFVPDDGCTTELCTAESDGWKCAEKNYKQERPSWCPLKEAILCGSNYFCLPEDGKGKAYLK